MAKINHYLKTNIKLIVFIIDIFLPILLFYSLQSTSGPLPFILFGIVGIARLAFVIFS